MRNRVYAFVMNHTHPLKRKSVLIILRTAWYSGAIGKEEVHIRRFGGGNAYIRETVWETEITMQKRKFHIKERAGWRRGFSGLVYAWAFSRFCFPLGNNWKVNAHYHSRRNSRCTPQNISVVPQRCHLSIAPLQAVSHSEVTQGLSPASGKRIISRARFHSR